MSLLADMTACGREYKVKDISLANLGRVEIEKAKVLMPGLMALRDELRSSQPFKGLKITVSLHITVQTAIFIETLTDLGAEVRWCSSNIFSTQDHVAAAVARDSASLFAWKDETLKDYWWCISNAVDWPGFTGGPDFIIDDTGDLTLFINEGVKAEMTFETTGRLPDPSSTDNVEFQIVLSIIRASMQTDLKKYSNMREKLVRFPGEPFAALQSVLSKFFYDMNGFGQFDVMIGKVAVVCGYNDVAGSCVVALKQAGARVIVYALQTPLEGSHEIVTMLEDHIVSIAHIFVTAYGNGIKNTITLAHMRKMKNNAVVCNMSSNSDEIDMFGLKSLHGVQCVTIKPHTDRYVFPDTESGIIVLGEGRLMNLGIFIPGSFINQLIAPEEHLKKKKTEELINGIMNAGSTERLPLIRNIPQALERMEARARAAAIQADMRDEAENWEEAVDMEVELDQLKATIHQISEEQLRISRAVDVLAIAMINDLV